MITLNSVSESDFQSILSERIKIYSIDLIKAEKIDETFALKKSSEIYTYYLPNGIHTRDNYFYNILDRNQQKIGFLWFRHCQNKYNNHSELMDIEIFESHRYMGYGSAAISHLMKEIKDKNTRFMKVFVFKHNLDGIRFYKKIGFKIMKEFQFGFFMNKYNENR